MVAEEVAGLVCLLNMAKEYNESDQVVDWLLVTSWGGLWE
jgi:hypothetical protein